MTPVVAEAANWEISVRALPELRIGYLDGLIVGLIPEEPNPYSDDRDMLLCDIMDVPADVMIGASIGVVQMSTVGLVMLHSRFTPVEQSRVAWAVGTRLRRQRLVAGTDPRVVMTGARPAAELVPDGVSFSAHRVRLRDGDAASVIEVWEVVYPFSLLLGESFTP